jgi:nitroreductase
MEFKEVIGRRRSIRHFDPDRPVEREKIQIILEAMRLASRAVNADFIKVIVVERDKLSLDILNALKTPVAATNYDMAPLHLYLFGDMKAIERDHAGRLKELVDVGVLTPSHGWSHKFVDELVWPLILSPLIQDEKRHMTTVAFDCGVAACQGLLVAYDEGLGACLSSFMLPPAVKEALAVPDHWLPTWSLVVGYPLDWEDGGQRPRQPFEDLFFEGRYGRPFKRDEKVVEKLKEAKMITAPAPLPGRKDQLREWSRRYGLPE